MLGSPPLPAASRQHCVVLEAPPVGGPAVTYRRVGDGCVGAVRRAAACACPAQPRLKIRHQPRCRATGDSRAARATATAPPRCALVAAARRRHQLGLPITIGWQESSTRAKKVTTRMALRFSLPEAPTLRGLESEGCAPRACCA